jgi:threonine synthase
MAPPNPYLVCTGCGARVSAAEAFPFRCPGAGGPEGANDDTDHVLTPVLDPGPAPGGGSWRDAFLADGPNPFLKFRRLLYSWHAARTRGLGDADFTHLVTRLDAAVAAVDGRGFRETPFLPAESLGRRLGFGDGGALWIKDETGNVSGSHKARHLMGVALWLEVLERAGDPAVAGTDRAEAPRLAVASCGNAALAAAVVARAAGRPLAVFVPPDAHPAVVERLTALDARLETCPRPPGGSGDPCVHRFHEALAAGALPFTCQGNENGLVIEGGQTLAWEMTAQLLRHGQGSADEHGASRLDRLFVQVGGGALASALVQGLERARGLGLLDRLPRIHAVQTRGAYPLRRAWDRLADRILERWWKETGGTLPLGEDAQRAEMLSSRIPSRLVEEELGHAATHRSEFMWPWETTPASLATGILDDETYDWLQVVRGMFVTGGYPVVVSERSLERAHRLAREETGIAAEPTGTAGLAGLLELREKGEVRPEETVAVLLTGVER